MEEVQEKPFGRPTKFNDHIREKIIELCKEGKTEDQIADLIGICRKTLFLWKGKYPDLLHAMEQGKLGPDDLVEIALFQRAVGYSYEATHFSAYEGYVTETPYIEHCPPDIRAAQFWLRNRRPKRWRREEEAPKNQSTVFTLAYKLD